MKVKAYYIGWTSPALTWGPKDKRSYLSIYIEWDIGKFQEIRRVKPSWNQHRSIASFEILRSYLGRIPTKYQVSELLKLDRTCGISGISLMRVEPEQLQNFKQERLV